MGLRGIVTSFEASRKTANCISIVLWGCEDLNPDLTHFGELHQGPMLTKLHHSPNTIRESVVLSPKMAPRRFELRTSRFLLINISRVLKPS